MKPVLAALAVVVVLVGGGAVLLAVFNARDDAGVAQEAQRPGELLPDQCAEHRAPAPGFRYATRPPASGPHRPVLVARDGRALSDDELIHALELGNVVLAYRDSRPPAGLRALQAQVAGPFDSELLAAGQAVVLARRADAGAGVLALAWRHRLRAASAGDPALRTFAEAWLGQGFAAAGASSCRRSG